MTPAAAYMEQALAAAEQLFGAGRHGVANLVIQQAMFLPEGVRRRVQVIASRPSRAANRRLKSTAGRKATSRSPTRGRCTPAASLVHESRVPVPQRRRTMLDHVDLDAVRERAVSITSHEDFYRMMAERGLAYGPAFRVLQRIASRRRRRGRARSNCRKLWFAKRARYRVHPALGDALLQLMAGAVPLEEDGSFSPFTYMPVGIRGVSRLPADSKISRSRCLLTRFERRANRARVRNGSRRTSYLINEAGEVLVALEGVQVQRLGRGGGG